VYRAHLTVYGSDDRRMGRRAIESAFSPRAVDGVLGTRHGIEGIWIERDTAARFRNAIEIVARFALETGFSFTIGCTNGPSKVQADYATFSTIGLRARDRHLIRTGRA
jgi:hypothetical protein